MPTAEMFLPVLKPFLYLLTLIAVAVFLKIFLNNLQYKESKYKDASGNSFGRLCLTKVTMGSSSHLESLKSFQGTTNC